MTAAEPVALSGAGLGMAPRALSETVYERGALDQETSAIPEGAEAAATRIAFELVTRWAAEPLDLARVALLADLVLELGRRGVRRSPALPADLVLELRHQRRAARRRPVLELGCRGDRQRSSTE